MTATQQPCWKTKWPLKRVKYLATCNDEVLPETTDAHFELDYLDIGNVTSTGVVTGTELLQFKAAPSRARRRVRHGDIIVSTVRTYLRAIARIDHPNPNLVVSTGFAVIRPGKEIDARFLGYALRSNEFVDEVVARSTGVSYPAISSTELIKIPAPLPPPSEQRRIADFLDRETDQIDRLIAEKEKLVGLLEEKRKAVISHAVTQGLNPNAKMRDSGVPWLGMIPEHWQVKRLKYLATCNDEILPESEDEYLEIEYIDIGSVDSYGAVTKTELLCFGRAPSRARRKVRNGDVIVSTVRTYLRAIARIVNPVPNLIVSTGFAVVRPKPEMEGRYLGHTLQSVGFIDEVVARSTGVSYPAITANELMNIPAPVPPPEEQRQIATIMDQRTVIIDQGVVECRRLLALLRERRAALISAAVTGRLDVRGAAE